MVRELHRAGIEVILDVVYNHTAEGNHLGPTLALPRHRQRRPTTGSSTRTRRSTTTPPAPATRSLMRNPHVLQLIMDSLRYWVTEMHVDGFRFDLAASLARQFHEVDRLSAFFDLVQQDPVVSQVKLIAEPWDVGPGGYQVGQLPAAVDRVERQVPRHRPRLLARRAVVARRVRGPAVGVERPLRERRPGAVRVDQLRDRPRRLHAARPDLVQRQAQRGQRRGQQRRREPQPVVELRRRGRDRRPRGARPAGTSGAQLPRHAAAQPGRADDPRRRRDGPHAGRQQQRLLPGQRDLVGRLEARRPPAAGVHPASHGAAGQASGLPPSAVLHRRRRRRTGCPTSPGSARTAPRWTTTTGRPTRSGRWRCSSTAPRSPSLDCAARTSVDDSFLLLLNPGHEDAAMVLPDGRSASGGSRCSTRPATP